LERARLETFTAKEENISALEGALRSALTGGRHAAKRRGRATVLYVATGKRGSLRSRSVPVRSVPRSVLASGPDSPVQGEWDYARDAVGRARDITCHPKRWALECLATGAAPAKRNPLVLEQARHWKLKRLVGALEALNPGVIVTNDSDSEGFKAWGTFVSVMERLGINGGIIRGTLAAPQDRWWAIEGTSDGVFLVAMASLRETL
jgi:hypothetical protein